MKIKGNTQLSAFILESREGAFLGAITGHGASPIGLVVLHLGDGQGRVRSQF